MNAAARMIDANANRAREALRVMEDAARFGLDSEPLCSAIKSLRHDLRAALETIAGGDLGLLANRDTTGDVGTRVTTAAEMTRRDLRTIAGAACKRLTEALRVIEECAKLDPSGPAGAIEAIRYRAYTVERDLMLALLGHRARHWRLCVLITESLCRLPWDEVAAAAIEGKSGIGADCLQLREKTLGGGELLARARALVAIARPRNVAVIINDRPDIALAAGADGVHLGQDDLPVADVRALAGDRLLVGVSTHTLDEANRAAHAGADYCGVGAMFATTTKDREPSGQTYLREYLAHPHLATIPHLAIGGITPDNVGQLASAGVRGVAVSSCVCAAETADDVGRVCAALVGAVARPIA